MSRILLDQNVPVGLRNLLTGHEVDTAYQVGWAALSNGELLKSAEAVGFNTVITCDQNIWHQQNMAGRKIAVVVLPTNNWSVLRDNVAWIVQAIERVRGGEDATVRFPSMNRRSEPGL